MRNKYLKGFTITEMIVVATISAILAALIFSVGSAAKRRAQHIKTFNNLKQLHLALTVYQLDYQEGVYGKASLMGLPDRNEFYTIPIYKITKSEDVWFSGCPRHPTAPYGRTGFLYYPDDWEKSWDVFVQQGEGNTVMIADFHCNDHSVNMYADLMTKKGIGITVDGSIRQKTARGTIARFTWWNNKGIEQ